MGQDKTQFLTAPVKAVNIGLRSFYQDLIWQGVDCVHVDWRPPAGGDTRLANLLDELNFGEIAAHIRKANGLAVERILAGNPVCEDVVPAIEVVPDMSRDMILYSGPPIAWQKMSGPMRGGIAAALMYEGRAKTPADAMEMAGGGAVTFSPCHEHDTVGAMAGVISPSMPVFVVRNCSFGNTAYCAWRDLAQASGAYDADTIQRMIWLRDTGMPALGAAIRSCGGVKLKPLWAKALMMGDEHHNRVSAGTSVFTRIIAPYLVRAADRDAAAQVLDYLAEFDLAIVPITMAGCKSVMNAASGIEASTVVTAIARNGVEVGIRVSGLGNQWFTGPAQLVKGTYHPGFSDKDACPDLGDSAIIETFGFGGCAIAAAPTHVTVRDEPGAAERYTKEMYEISLAENPGYPIPTLDFRGIPCGIDIRRVVETGILPIVDTPIAHREPGKYSGVIGFGMSRPPMECFLKAIKAFEKKYNR
ncbi:MAG: DUF1116 domain-containing protein [Thermodesulfobacteriota bacterium]|jgi:hypothetical protein